LFSTDALIGHARKSWGWRAIGGEPGAVETKWRLKRSPISVFCTWTQVCERFWLFDASVLLSIVCQFASGVLSLVARTQNSQLKTLPRCPSIPDRSVIELTDFSA
jgi:hypothetical protein